MSFDFGVKIAKSVGRTVSFETKDKKLEKRKRKKKKI
jgi:hypothetical protein